MKNNQTTNFWNIPYFGSLANSPNDQPKLIPNNTLKSQSPSSPELHSNITTFTPSVPSEFLHLYKNNNTQEINHENEITSDNIKIMETTHNYENKSTPDLVSNYTNIVENASQLLVISGHLQNGNELISYNHLKNALESKFIFKI